MEEGVLRECESVPMHLVYNEDPGFAGFNDLATSDKLWYYLSASRRGRTICLTRCETKDQSKREARLSMAYDAPNEFETGRFKAA